MRVLQINCVYNNGSTGKITSVLHNEYLKNGIDSFVCYGRGDDCREANVFKVGNELYSKANHLLSKITGVNYDNCLWSTEQIIKLIKHISPDIVHLQCINGYFVNIYKLLTYLKKNNIKTVLTLHAEFMYTGGCGCAYVCEKWRNNPGCGNCSFLKTEVDTFFRDGTRTTWSKMKKAFDGFENLSVVSVSPWLMNRAMESSILKDKNNSYVFNGLDTDIFTSRDNYDKNSKTVFHVSPKFDDDVNNNKGGRFVLELAKRMPDVKFIVAGNYSLQGAVPDNVELLGRVSDGKKLSEYYSSASLTLLTSQREAFSMVCAESLCCGTPVVGFKAGAPEQISLSEYSEFVEYGNVDLLEKAVTKWLNTDKPDDISETAKERYSKENMAKNYIRIYRSMQGENNG